MMGSPSLRVYRTDGFFSQTLHRGTASLSSFLLCQDFGSKVISSQAILLTQLTLQKCITKIHTKYGNGWEILG